MAKLLITYTKCAIGYSKDQKATIRSLGLHKLNSKSVQADTPSIRGMLFKVRHLVSVEEIGDEVAETPAARLAIKSFARTAVAETDEVEVDNLENIKDIGTKIACVLKAAGITTFAQLASTEIARLSEILLAADLRMANPETWPEQASIAAAGNWAELKQLQDR